jgi:predicted 3-demethylubiquinone-9 3-methyltransferase (glyoxalase superfamily)
MCETQDEIDRHWTKLSAGGDATAQQCGWLKDRFGLSWQVIPEPMLELIGDPSSPRSQRAFKAMMQMKKLDLAAVKRAYEG